MRQTILIIGLALISLPLVRAQTLQGTQASNSSNVEQVIRRLEDESRVATLKNDAAVIDRLLADNWMNTNANGTVTTKAQLMALLKSGTFKIMSIENDDVLVRVYGDAAIVTGRSTSRREGEEGTAVTRQVRFTRVWAKLAGRWQVVAAQTTPITQQ